MKTLGLTAMAGLALMTGGCMSASSGAVDPGEPALARVATANLRTATNSSVGTATAESVPGGIRLTVDATGMPPGTHGVHIHMTGRCDAPDFMTAGGHWNPAGMQHGTQNPAGPHAGDLPNLIIGTNGAGSVAITLNGAQFDGLMDADGSAMVVHAGADDLRTDPSGNSGSRIACGVFSEAS